MEDFPNTQTSLMFRMQNNDKLRFCFYSYPFKELSVERKDAASFGQSSYFTKYLGVNSIFQISVQMLFPQGSLPNTPDQVVPPFHCLSHLGVSLPL